MRYARTWQFLAALGALGFGAANGCGGATTPVGTLNAAIDGQTCGPVGSSAEAADGCNTCVCASNGHWACTKMACGGTGAGTGTGSGTTTGTGTGSTGTGSTGTGSVCKDGEIKMAPDGCNSCTCSGGAWACTEKGCPNPVCKDGETKIAPDGCNTCGCTGGQWACTLKGCPTPVCKDGETMKPDCNTCTCAGGQWACTDIACPAPECKPGDTKQVDCNKCGCTEDGRWACTLIACGPTCPAPVQDGRVCPPVVVYAKDPLTGGCCEYGDPCRAPAGWKQFTTPDECAKP